MNLVIFLFGLCIGSFMNVCIYRIPRNMSVVYPSSSCTSCGVRIKWYDLIPLMSYIILLGKCRNCKVGISFKYPVIELVSGLIFTLLYIKFGLTLDFFKYVTFISLLIIISAIDYFTMNVYSKVTWLGIILSGIFLICNCVNDVSIWTNLLGGMLGWGITCLIIITTKAMGWGDAEVFFMCGIFLGFKLTVFIILISFIIGGITALALVLIKQKSIKDYIPFVPFIALAGFIAAMWGDRLINWYIALI